MKIMASIIALIVTLAAAGCARYHREPGFRDDLTRGGSLIEGFGERQRGWLPAPERYTQRFVWKMQYLAWQLREKAMVEAASPPSVLMTTIVQVDNLYKATGFGRLLTEQLMTELTRQDFKVYEARKTDVYLLRDNEGEFSLSRDAYWLSDEYKADSVLVGSYSVSSDQVVVNVRLVDSRDAQVLGAASAMMNLKGDRFLKTVITQDTAAASPEQNTGEMRIRKRVLPDADPHAEVLESQVAQMAGEVSAAAAPVLANGSTIAVATFVDVDNLYRATTFGRYVAEQLIAELHSLGYKTLEVRMAPDLYVDVRIGELSLSREMSQVMMNRKADAVLLGTYTRAGENLAVNARMIVGKNQAVVGAGQIIVDASGRNKFVTAMLEHEVTVVMPTETVEGF